jgi:hypothetical protein
LLPQLLLPKTLTRLMFVAAAAAATPAAAAGCTLQAGKPIIWASQYDKYVAEKKAAKAAAAQQQQQQGKKK